MRWRRGAGDGHLKQAESEIEDGTQLSVGHDIADYAHTPLIKPRAKANQRYRSFATVNHGGNGVVADPGLSGADNLTEYTISWVL